ncbi:MAG: magnesium transporter [Ignisphaera sp.]|jgi:magnesium transporter|nr:magnesium transporter [Ignisphaera sp.]
MIELWLLSGFMEVLELVEQISELVEAGRAEDACKLFDRLTPQDVVEVLLRLSNSVRRKVLAVLDLSRVAEALASLPIEVVHDIAYVKGVDDITKAVSKLPVDEAADFLFKLPPRTRSEVLRLLPKDFSKTVVELMKYPPESVGGIMTTMVPVFPGDMTVGEVISAYVEKVRVAAYEPHHYIYAVNGRGVLVGYIDLRTLFTKPRTAKLSDCVQPVKFVVRADADREEAAKIAVRYDLLEVPVVDAENRFLGIVTLDDLLDVISSEYQEDLLKYAGIAEAIRGSYITEKPLKLALKRAPVLVYLYLMNSITGSIVAAFTSVIEKIALLAAFMPMLADNSGNIGAQSSAMIIRGLVTGEIRISRRDLLFVLKKEFITSTLLLLVLLPISFAIGFTIPFIATGSPLYSLKIATTVAIALAVSSYVADVVGALLPIALAKLRMDPAVASAPVITTIGDIATVTTYFIIASLLFQIL